MYIRLPALGHGAELGTALTLEGLTRSPWPHGPTSAWGSQELPVVSVLGLSPAEGGQQGRRARGQLPLCASLPRHWGWSTGASQEESYARISIGGGCGKQISNQMASGCQGLGQLRTRDLARVFSASRGPTSRSGG